MICVALYTSAWIEIMGNMMKSLIGFVALYTSAWIEIPPESHEKDYQQRRTLHECVD